MVKPRTKTKRRIRYNQHGCSNKMCKHNGMCKQNGGYCPSCQMPSSFGKILGIAQNGGCGTCGMKGECDGTCGMKGGSFYKPAPPLPAPFVGSPWGPKISEWPGVDGVDGGRNYFTDNLYKQDPQTMMKLGGSRRRKGTKGRRHIKSRRRGIKGGAPFQTIKSLGSDLSYNFESMYNSLNGYKAPVNPAPYADQFSRTMKSSL